MQKKCRRCGDTFTVSTHEDYCPECEKIMTPPGTGVSRELTCEGCGTTFIHKKEKEQGRWPKYRPTCAEKYSKPYKKEEDDKKSKLKQTLQKELDAVQKEDVVNHPPHYTRGKIEVIDFIEDQQFPYHLGNVIKYISRAGHKGDKLEDLKKSAVVSSKIYRTDWQ